MGRITNYTANHDRIHGIDYLWEHDLTGALVIITDWREGYQSSRRNNYYIRYVLAKYIPDDVTMPHEINDHYRWIDNDSYRRKDNARKAAVELMKHNPQGIIREIQFDYGHFELWGETNLGDNIINS